MARKIRGIADFTGTIDILTFYKMRGSDELLVRAKGGPSKEQIEKLKSFEKTRKLNAEFGVRSGLAQWINQAMFPLKSLADYTYIGKMNAVLRPVQELDTKREFGERSVDLKKNPSVLNGFSLNRKNVFETFVRVPVDVAISDENTSVRISIPPLRNKVNFYMPDNYKYPAFAIIVSIGPAPDMFYSPYGYHNNGRPLPMPEWKQSEWQLVKKGSPQIDLELLYPKFNQSYTTKVLSIGICFGDLAADGEFERVKYAGAAKILSAW